jgi:thiosulfate reductase cytochrome b subunit
MPLLDIFWTMLWFFLFFAWIWLLISIFADIFRSDMSGWSKALWTIFVIVLPLLGVLIYLIVNGGDMQERSIKQASDLEKAQQDYIRSVAGGGEGASTADELAKLGELRDKGVISAEEFDAQKAKLLA